jgi:hypothetical protein
MMASLLNFSRKIIKNSKISHISRNLRMKAKENLILLLSMVSLQVGNLFRCLM